MNVVCTHCAHEFDLPDEVAADTGGTAPCPSCGEQVRLDTVPSGATLPWHPGEAGMPPGPHEAGADGMFDAAIAASADQPSPPPPKPKEESVLFKLGGIQAMATQSQAREGGGPPDASGLLDIRMLAATIHQHEEATHKVQFVGKAQASGPIALPTSSAALAPSPAEPKSKVGLIIAGVVFLLLIVTALVLVYVVYAGKQKEQGSGDKQAAAADSMEPAMGSAVMDSMEPAMRPEAMRPGMRPVMAPVMRPEPMEPPKPIKKPRKLYRKHIKAGLATVADKIADCKKDRKGRFKLRITVTGKTGKVKRVKIRSRSKRKSKTGRCLIALFEKAQFTPFKRRRQTFTHRVRVK